MKTDTASELMRRTREGDDKAFVALVDRFRQRAVNVAYRYLGDQSSAEDVAQEAFVRIYERSHSYDPSHDFSPWFYKILANLCRDRLRKRSSQNMPLEAVADTTDENAALFGSTSAPAEEAERTELSRRVSACLTRLPDRQRMALILQHYEDMSYREIAEVMDCSSGTVDGLLSRARASLREWLGDYLEMTAETTQPMRIHTWSEEDDELQGRKKTPLGVSGWRAVRTAGQAGPATSGRLSGVCGSAG